MAVINNSDVLHLWHSGATGSMVQSMVQQLRAGENLIMYSDSDKMKVKQRFYDYLNRFFLDSESKKNIIDHFDIQFISRTDFNPEKLDDGQYYKLAIGLFYFLQDKRDYIWFRDENTILNIKRENLSGSIYFSPFSEDKALIYLGKSTVVSRGFYGNSTNIVQSNYHCFLGEGLRNLFYANDYHMSRMTMIHEFGSSLIKTFSCTYVSINVTSNQDKEMLGDLILSGKLSDQKIECIDGPVNISRAFLSLQSEYFCYLFTNAGFTKQNSFQLDFEKKQLENYIYFLCGQYEKVNITQSLIQDIMFGSFVQDKKYLIYLYHIIVDSSVDMDLKDQLEIVSAYQSFGFQIA
jgi:hypothetical protein